MLCTCFLLYKSNMKAPPRDFRVPTSISDFTQPRNQLFVPPPQLPRGPPVFALPIWHTIVAVNSYGACQSKFTWPCSCCSTPQPVQIPQLPSAYTSIPNTTFQFLPFEKQLPPTCLALCPNFPFHQ